MIFNKLRLPASSRPQRVATRPLSRRNLSRRISARYHYFPFFPFWKHSLHAFFDDFESIFRIWSIFVGMMIKPKYPLKTNISSLPWGYGKKICIWFWPTKFFKIMFSFEILNQLKFQYLYEQINMIFVEKWKTGHEAHGPSQGCSFDQVSSRPNQGLSTSSLVLARLDCSCWLI